MRIAFLVGKFPKLSETFILNQITGMIDRGHEVTIFGRKPSEIPAKQSDVTKYRLLNRVTFIPKFSSSKLGRIADALNMLSKTESPIGAIKLFKTLKFWKYGHVSTNLRLWYAVSTLQEQRASYDIIHAHFGPNGALAVALRDLNMLEGKIVTTFHGSDMTKYIDNTKYLGWAGVNNYRYLSNKGDLFLPISRKWKKKLINIGFPKERVRVHHMGVDTDNIDFVAPSVEEGVARVITVCRLTEKKGIEYGLRAITKCIRNSSFDIKYTVVGDGERRDYLESLVDSLGISEYVSFLGWKNKSNVIDLLGDDDLFLLPSVTAESNDQEGIPVAIMEAMARGLPVVSTWHSGIPELVKNGVSGLLVPERDVTALADALQFLLRRPNKLTEMGRAGRSVIEEEFDVEALNDMLVKHYKAALR